jgi:DNA-binding protein HU-beta
MNKNELIEALSSKTGSSKPDAARAVTALTEIMPIPCKKAIPSP